MPRNALLSRNSQPGAGPSSTPQQPIPAIRFISATPSTHEPSEAQIEINMDAYPLPINPVAPFTATPLAPRTDTVASPRKRLVPKKSKLSLLSAGAKGLGKDKSKSKNKADDLSDVMRRVGAGSSRNGGFEIYVDQEEDASIVVVKKKKSRAALDNVGWGGNALGEVTNVGSSGNGKALGSKENKAGNTLKVPGKGDENQNSKWWNVSIGRGRKDSKNKENTQVRSKTPEPFGKVEAEPRARFNSLDSSRLLSTASPKPKAADAPPAVPPKDIPPPPQRQRTGTFSSLSTLLTVPGYDSGTDGLLAPPAPPDAPAQGQGSIALRAMRSMRSIARMKSWANLGTDKEGNTNDTTATNPATTATISRTKEKKKSKKKEEKKPERVSTSSFEVGALSVQGSPLPPDATINKKPSKLAVGGLLPGSLRLGTVRPAGSRVPSTSSAAPSPLGTPLLQPGMLPVPNTLYGHPNARLSVDSSAHLVLAPNGRPTSAYSYSSLGSSLRPPSTASGISEVSRSSVSGGSGMSASAFSTRSARSSSSSVVSVRWDEEGIAGVKAMQRREREARREEVRNNPAAAGRESRRSAEGRRRTPIMDVFPEVRRREVEERRTSVESGSGSERAPPMVMLEEATTDGHGTDSEASFSGTPVKRARPRPISEQLLGKARPKGMSDDADGVLSILDQATNELASLINRLDLEATPASVKGSPLQPLRESASIASLGLASDDSPLKRRKCTFDKNRDAPLLSNRDSTLSVNSLRPYALQHQPQKTNQSPTVLASRQQALDTLEARRKLIGQQIVPWSELDWQVSPKKKPSPPQTSTVKPFRPTHRRTVTPGPELDLGPVFQPLRPAAQSRVASVESIPSAACTPLPAAHDPTNPSSQTFGSETRAGKVGKRPSQDLGYDEAAPPSPSPTAKRAGKHARKSSVLSILCDTGALLPRDSLKNLGLAGTLGGPEPEIDAEDPDSDIPDELQNILSGQSDDDTTHSFADPLSIRRRSRAPSPGLPPLTALPVLQDTPQEKQLKKEASIPVFRAALFDEDANQADVDEGDGSASEDDTGKSFDFTGELQRLNESGGSDRRSFVEQLENAFRTPARVELGFNLGSELFQKAEEAPPLPALPLEHRETPDKDLVPQSVSQENSMLNLETSVEESYRDSATSDTLDRLLGECEDDICRPYPEMRRSQSSMRSKESDGQLNTSFRFGGKPSIPDSVDESTEDRPLTLSDIIPPLSHASSHASSLFEGDSLLKSILGKAYEDDTSVVNSIMAHAQAAGAVPRPRFDSDSSSKRQAREIAEISRSSHSRTTSEVSFQGFESFDEVRRGFEFHANRPAFYPPPGATTSRGWHNKHESVYSIASVSSYGAVINSGTADPFGYRLSTRPASMSDDASISMSITVDDTFSFLKKDPHRKRVDSDASSFYYRPGARRGHRRNESNFSVTSAAPPVSLYNRSFGAHRRNDSGTSMSSVAQSYAMHGANGGRAAWARHHRQEPSGDSIFSEFSAVNVARPGLGDKMFEMMDYGMPLSAISASPTGSSFSEQEDQSERYKQTTMYDSIFSGENRNITEDSLFEKTGQRTSYETTEDVFEFDLSHTQQESFMRLNQFRPISMMSIASVHSVAKDEDTMITMLGGGHVRRRSVDSCIDGSPCVPLERKKNTALQHLARVLRFDQGDDELPASVADRLSKVSPDKAVVPKPSIASTSSYQFGTERMIKAGKGLLERQSLEESALIAHGEDILASFESSRVFSRPGPANRSRSSTVTTASSGVETPPLSSSDGSSVSSGSQSSIDLGHLNTLLTGATFPTSGIARARSVRARARGTGHRRRLSQARASRSSVYETIQEESVVLSSSPSPAKSSEPSTVRKESTLTQHDSVYIVDPETASMNSEWDNEHGIVNLRKYYALRDEAEDTVTESKKVWIDTPFSVFALQSFEPPTSRNGMQAMLEHSQKNYGPLPSELRPYRVRSRTSSRASPYPVRPRRVSFTVDQQCFDFIENQPFAEPEEPAPVAPLREISINPNITVFSAPPTLDVKPFSPFSMDVQPTKPQPLAPKTAYGLPRPRVTSSARRSALGWSKRSSGAPKSSTGTTKSSTGTAKSSTGSKSSTGKENENAIGQGSMFSPNDSLRISRPRPRGRPTPARTALAAV